MIHGEHELRIECLVGRPMQNNRHRLLRGQGFPCTNWSFIILANKGKERKLGFWSINIQNACLGCQKLKAYDYFSRNYSEIILQTWW